MTSAADTPTYYEITATVARESFEAMTHEERATELFAGNWL